MPVQYVKGVGVQLYNQNLQLLHASKRQWVGGY